MERKHLAANCRWATPTLLLEAPWWLDAWDFPWTCVRDPVPHPLPTTDICILCSRWEPHHAQQATTLPEPINGC